ncbi:MAG: chemotaxis protein CheW [Desulfuromonadaceae bacterium]|nr:chemotaxis protein CheW [Desulfuromonadaceae bacterium]MDD5105424.1 chemotaxis protein CheW [Desulfuromonadaceae bacterium]
MESTLTHIQLACFSIADKLFAVDIMRIREIIVPQILSPLPRASELLDGVINLRGDVIPVMNMRTRLGVLHTEDHPVGKFLIVTLARQLLALVVDDVKEVISVSVTDIKPPIQSATGGGLEFILGICLYDDRVFMILDIDSLLDSRTTVHTDIPV